MTNAWGHAELLGCVEDEEQQLAERDALLVERDAALDVLQKAAAASGEAWVG